jgi:diguanylate cyclase (GGDEF)-like protein
LLPETDVIQAQALAHRLLTLIQQTPIQTEKGGVFVTISIGVANFTGSGPFNLDQMLDQADDALYTSKMNGRNQVMAWQPALDARLLPQPTSG